ncbi:GNAT family N-acetyltransferase [Paenibacillus campi]|uniref:GNAT family N-acetyltransferase n=1 Tax=Paenibacillus campi TaxID=3106031 RepID=UPI002AFF7423|nr:GNAT family N-acetyltransferase [Paenibacillus sp. SGZ-1009]
MIHINLAINNEEVPNLRAAVGWTRRDCDYPALFQRCTFWAGARDEQGMLIAFGYVAGMGLEHGYMEDIMIHPNKQSQGIGQRLVTTLLAESKVRGLDIVTLTYVSEHQTFYEQCGFAASHAGIWRAKHL